MRFFLIDRITRWEPGKAAEAVKNIALSEDFFDDHFPRRPVMPGVLILEGMAQLSGLLLEASLSLKSREAQSSAEPKAILTIIEKTKFRDMARPGDTLTYQAEVIALNDEAGKARVTAACGERVIVTTEMVFAFKYVDDPVLREKRQSLMKTWLAGD